MVWPNSSQPGHLLPNQRVKLTVAWAGARSKANIEAMRIMMFEKLRGVVAVFGCRSQM